jgi:transcriptional regulator with XRE-family HTH domain
MSEMDVYGMLGSAVAQRRKALGLTQADIAARIGMTRASIANIETGRQKVLLHQVYLLANALGLDSIHPLAPDVVADGPRPPSLPIRDGTVTGVQRAQVERAIQRASARGKPLERRST